MKHIIASEQRYFVTKELVFCWDATQPRGITVALRTAFPNLSSGHESHPHPIRADPLAANMLLKYRDSDR